MENDVFGLKNRQKMDRKGSSEFLGVAGAEGQFEETSESVSFSEMSATGADSSSKGSASPTNSKSLCSSTSTSAENVAGADTKVII